MRLKKYDTQINVSLNTDLKNEMESLAAQLGMSMSEFAREAIRVNIRRYRKESRK